MRLRNYILNENLTYDSEMLLELCMPYIKECRKADKFLCRGYGSNNAPILRRKPRKDRKPKDTDLQVHNVIDDLLYKKFKWKPRSEGVFTFGGSDAYFANYKQYGNPYIVFPIGDFKFVWSKEIDDLTFYLSTRVRILDFDYKLLKPIEDIMYRLVKVSEKYTDKDLPSAIKSGCEVILKCKEYFMFDAYRFSESLRKDLL